VKFLKFQELGKVNEAFENDSQQRDTFYNSSLSNGLPTATAADEKRNVVFIVINH
jgi:hypothetical protein